MIMEHEARQLLVEYGKKLLSCKLVQGTWGNISIRLDEKYMVVTPSGMDYDRLTADDMVKVDISTLKYEGNLPPTSEKELHAAVYQKRSDVGAVIHTHSVNCAVFAAANADIPIEDEEMQEIFGTCVKCGGHGTPGSAKLARNTVEALGDNFGCIMANHGMIACGKDIETAFDNCKSLEKCAKTYLDGKVKQSE